MKRSVAVIALVTFFWAITAQAEMKLFPMWERMQCPTEEFACYTFEQSQAILKLDIDLQSKLGKLDVCLKNVIDLKTAVKNLDDANTLLHGNIARFEIRLTEKDKALVTSTDLMIKYQARDVFGGALPWVITAVVVVAAGAFVGGYYVGSR